MTAIQTVHPPTEEPAKNLEPGVSVRRRGFQIVGFFVVLLALATSGTSFLILTGQTNIEPTPIVVRSAGWINGAVVLLLAGVVASEAAGLWIARKKGRAAARLHVRIVALFAVIAALPAFLMAIIASVTLDRGLDRWFAEQTQAIIDSSLTVAQAYVQEHSRLLAIDLLAIANEFNRVTPNLETNVEPIAAYLSNQAQLRGLSAVSLIRGDRSTILAGETRTNLEVPPPPLSVIQDAESNQPVLIAPGTTNLVGGVIRLSNLDDAFLYVARPIDPKVTRYVRLTEQNAEEFNLLSSNRFGIQVAFAILFIGMALVVLLSAMWLGLAFANRLVAPIRQLIGAARDISAGNLDVTVPARRSAGDLGLLAETFNTMSRQLKTQRNELLEANDELDERRRFSEAVLAGVSAGVIGLDSTGKVTLANSTAMRILHSDAASLIDQPITEVAPELMEVVAAALTRGRATERTQIALAREGEQRTFNVQVTREHSDHGEDGLVVTLDDITDLVAAQRRSAWADVARRIAHEIKNPLTPIQLSAERIMRRYGKRIDADDREVFDQCTETIVRQVGDIRRMVDEFSAFARMPKAVMEERDLRGIVREATFLQEVGSPDIRFELQVPDDPVMAFVDDRLVTQALTNIVKNATESIEGVPLSERGDGSAIDVRVYGDKEHAYIDVQDTGKGLPKADREALLEPYMTTREKGTGLGLAIVLKVMQEHGGSISLQDAPSDLTNPDGPPRGALIRLIFPTSEQQTLDPTGSVSNESHTAETT